MIQPFKGSFNRILGNVQMTTFAAQLHADGFPPMSVVGTFPPDVVALRKTECDLPVRLFVLRATMVVEIRLQDP